MKKQILILAIFTLALIVSNSKSYGQGAIKWSDPRPFTCTDDFLHPIAGISYSYDATATDPTGTGAWRFWATTNPDFITDNSGTPVFNTGTALTIGANELIATSLDYNIEIGVSNSNENSDGNVDITWSSTILNGTDYQVTPTFVVAYYVNADGCTDNIKVWELDPMLGFIVDVIAMDPADFAGSKDAYDPASAPETCVDVIESATYSGGTMHYNYGDNYLYFEFIAANFTGSWIPTFELTGINSVQSITSYEYTLETPNNWDGTETWSTLTSGTTSISPDASVTDISQGVSIFVRVLVDHLNYENLAGQTLTMTLDGQDADSNWDVQNDNCAAPDPNAQDNYDTATSIITPRPTITPDNISTITPNTTIITGDEAN